MKKFNFKDMILHSFKDRFLLEYLKKSHDLQYTKAVNNILNEHYKEKPMSIPPILQRVKDKGYMTFENGHYNLNIIGVRTSSRIANKFDDWLHVVFKDENDNWVNMTFQITTDAGLYHLKNPSRIEGTAILMAGQYRSSHKI